MAVYIYLHIYLRIRRPVRLLWVGGYLESFLSWSCIEHSKSFVRFAETGRTGHLQDLEGFLFIQGFIDSVMGFPRVYIEFI